MKVVQVKGAKDIDGVRGREGVDRKSCVGIFVQQKPVSMCPCSHDYRWAAVTVPSPNGAGSKLTGVRLQASPNHYTKRSKLPKSPFRTPAASGCPSQPVIML